MNLNLENIRLIKFSLLKKESDVKDGITEYSKRVTAKFIIPENFNRSEEQFNELCKQMFNDLLKNAPDDADSLGLWIELNNITLENSISLKTLDEFKNYSINEDKINPVFEFFKITLLSYNKI